MKIKGSISICLKCGYVSVRQKEKYCPACGAGLIQKCRHCGEPIEHPMAHYCSVCGEKYTPAGRNTSEQ
jgi:ribosomal protein L37E